MISIVELRDRGARCNDAEHAVLLLKQPWKLGVVELMLHPMSYPRRQTSKRYCAELAEA